MASQAWTVYQDAIEAALGASYGGTASAASLVGRELPADQAYTKAERRLADAYTNAVQGAESDFDLASQYSRRLSTTNGNVFMEQASAIRETAIQNAANTYTAGESALYASYQATLAAQAHAAPGTYQNAVNVANSTYQATIREEAGSWGVPDPSAAAARVRNLLQSNYDAVVPLLRSWSAESRAAVAVATRTGTARCSTTTSRLSIPAASTSCG